MMVNKEQWIKEFQEKGLDIIGGFKLETPARFGTVRRRLVHDGRFQKIINL